MFSEENVLVHPKLGFRFIEPLKSFTAVKNYRIQTIILADSRFRENTRLLIFYQLLLKVLS